MVNAKTFVAKNKKVLVVGAVLVLIAFIFSGAYQQGSIGYLSGTQGLNIEFNSLRYKNYWWSANEQGPATAIWSRYDEIAEQAGNPALAQPAIKSFGSTMDFDPDGSGTGMADILASTQTMTRDSDTPKDTYVWSVEGGTVTLDDGRVVHKSTQFEMYRYRMDWAMNLWLSGPEAESDGWVWTSHFGTDYGYSTKYYLPDNNYGSSELWLKLEPKNFVYFTDNPDIVYFAPCYIALAEPAQFAGINPDKTKTLNDPDMEAITDLIPESTGEALGIYYMRGATDVDMSTSELLSYQGHTLDPQIFRNEYWTRINLVNFVPKSWWNFPYVNTHGWKFPSVYLHFVVDLFVVGQWTVYYETGEVPELEPHYPSTQYDFLTELGTGLANLFSNPLTQLWVFFLLIIAVVILITVFNPGFWTFIASMFKSRKGGGRNG